MTDQTRNEWRLGVRGDDLGTLVVITDQGMAPVLQNLAAQFAMQPLDIGEESQVKLYFQGIPYGLASDLPLQQFEYAWIPAASSTSSSARAAATIARRRKPACAPAVSASRA
jgi:hypothetical protein